MSEKINYSPDFFKEEEQKRFENLPEKEQGKTVEDKEEIKIIVEIGHGGQPIYQKDRYGKLGKDIKENEYYIGIDLLDSSSEIVKIDFPKLSPDILKKIKEKDSKRENVKGKLDFIIGSGENLPLADKSVDHIIFKDIFGYDFEKKFKERIREIKQNLINESARVLKEGGKFEIIETYSPEAASRAIENILDNPKHNSKFDLDKFITIERGKGGIIESEKEVDKKELLLEIKSDKEGAIHNKIYSNKGGFRFDKSFRIIFIKKENEK